PPRPTSPPLPPSLGPCPERATTDAVSPAEKARPAATGDGFTQDRSSATTTLPPEIKVKNPKGNREYILVVEDDFEVAELAAEMLAEEGYKLIVARDGFEALII